MNPPQQQGQPPQDNQQPVQEKEQLPQAKKQPVEKQEQKRRSCDECRSRKLACSKELDGCARCKKEGVECVYSSQKPMGRPRKRPCPDQTTSAEERGPKERQAKVSQPKERRPRERKLKEHLQNEPPRRASPTVARATPSPSMTPGTSSSSMSVPSISAPSISAPSLTTAAPHSEPITPMASTPIPTPVFSFEQFDPLAPIHTIADLDFTMPDLDWSLQDHLVSDMSFLDFMNLDPHQPFDPEIVAPESRGLTFPVEAPKYQGGWHFGDGGLFSGLNFDNLGLDMSTPDFALTPDPNHTLDRNILNSLNSPTVDQPDPPIQTPSLSGTSPSGSSPSATNSTASSLPSPPESSSVRPSIPCVCLANLYLALDGLQRLSTDVRDAVCAARYASRVAHDCMQCESCSLPMVSQVQPPIQSTQNMLILSALLPSIANSYMRIVDMVDVESQRAIAERRKLFFSIQDFGGMWGRAGEEKECQETRALQGDMDPMLWRQVLRAMLKLDVYGVDGCEWQPRSQWRHKGLRDVIDQMEERSIKRHAYLDSLDAEATLKLFHCPTSMIPLNAGEKPTCMRIIEMAKLAVEGIVIP